MLEEFLVTGLSIPTNQLGLGKRRWIWQPLQRQLNYASAPDASVQYCDDGDFFEKMVFENIQQLNIKAVIRTRC